MKIINLKWGFNVSFDYLKNPTLKVINNNSCFKEVP